MPMKNILSLDDSLMPKTFNSIKNMIIPIDTAVPAIGSFNTGQKKAGDRVEWRVEGLGAVELRVD